MSTCNSTSQFSECSPSVKMAMPFYNQFLFQNDFLKVYTFGVYSTGTNYMEIYKFNYIIYRTKIKYLMSLSLVKKN